MSALKNNFLTVLNCLDHINLTANKKKDRDEAKEIKNKINNYDFILNLVFQYNVLQHVNHLSKILEYKSIKLDEATKWLDNISTELKKLRLNFEIVESQAKTIAESMNIESNLKDKRNRKIQSFKSLNKYFSFFSF